VLGLKAQSVTGSGHFWATLNPRGYDVPLWAGLVLFVAALVLGFFVKKKGPIHLPHRSPLGRKKQTERDEKSNAH